MDPLSFRLCLDEHRFLVIVGLLRSCQELVFRVVQIILCARVIDAAPKSSDQGNAVPAWGPLGLAPDALACDAAWS